MELDPRQGDLFLDLLEGGKKDEYPNYRSKFLKDRPQYDDLEKPNPKPLPNPG